MEEEATSRFLPKHMTAKITGKDLVFNVVKISGSERTFRGWCPYHKRNEKPAAHVTWGGVSFKDMFFCMDCKRSSQAELQDMDTGKRPVI